jgi:hypothetical protein
MMEEQSGTRLDSSRADAEVILRRFQQWGLLILREREAELLRSMGVADNHNAVADSEASAEEAE